MRTLLFIVLGALLTSSCSQQFERHSGNPEFSPLSQPGSDISATSLKTLLRFEEYADSVWNDFKKIPNCGYWGDGLNGGNGAQWGHSWQSSLWAGTMALCAAQIEKRLDQATLAAVKTVLIDEGLLYHVGSKANGSNIYDVPNKYNRLCAAEDRIAYKANNPGETRYLILYPQVPFDESQSLINEVDWSVQEKSGSLKYLSPDKNIIEVAFNHSSISRN
ncbi:MAG: hypothetical protein GYB33_00400 [Gammaproteobacteria bacterium]|nr:hypothetical protein [Gammaproteobacteria bacterium]